MVTTLDRKQRRKLAKGRNWDAWPRYDDAASGLRNYWYPVRWATEVTDKPQEVLLCGVKIVLVRDSAGKAHALNNRCPHRGVRLSEGSCEFKDTISCPYHGWTFRLSDGELVAVITDGPDSSMCGNVAVQTYDVEERLGLVWIFVPEEGKSGASFPLDDQLPEELVNPPRMQLGGRIEERDGNWRFYAENGFDEGHGKYLHRTSKWRTFRTMPVWNLIHIERHGRWLYRVEDERHWDADFPGLGKWSTKRWWKKGPLIEQGKSLGNTGGEKTTDPYIEAQNFPGFASLSLPGVLRIAYPHFIHYEFYVPMDANQTRYVGVMTSYKRFWGKAWFYAKYLSVIRWLFHGEFSSQDHWMVGETTAPPERLYRPDVSLLEWRKLFSEPHPLMDMPPDVEDGAESENAPILKAVQND